ncbi:MAG: hypothetical protein QOG43_2897 [Actinomycetota bacterium]|jgi:hypothetical protein|nr:hypothetical protein [Actinomycetota bacterium]
MNIDARATAKAIAVGRMALGASYSLAPGLALRLWPGQGSDDEPAARFLARSTGVRDLAIGIGTFLALQKDAPARGWLEAGMLADAGDALAVVLGFRALPRARAVLALTAAAGTVVVGRRLVGELSEKE